eukprot:COSAG06_NODE_260_length_18911_cov_107.646236_8_plen_37_part_00
MREFRPIDRGVADDDDNMHVMAASGARAGLRADVGA